MVDTSIPNRSFGRETQDVSGPSADPKGPPPSTGLPEEAAYTYKFCSKCGANMTRRTFEKESRYDTQSGRPYQSKVLLWACGDGVLGYGHDYIHLDEWLEWVRNE